MKFKGREIELCELGIDLILSRNWWWINSGKIKPKYYLTTRIKGKTIYFHRSLMNAKKCQIVDHKDGNTLNCKKDNLRFVTASENRLNAAPRESRRGIPKGVYQKKGSKKFYAMFQKSGCPKVWIGSFDSMQEAEKAYNNFSITKSAL